MHSRRSGTRCLDGHAGARSRPLSHPPAPVQVLIEGESVAVMAFDKFPDHRFLVQAVGMEPWGFSELMVIA